MGIDLVFCNGIDFRFHIGKAGGDGCHGEINHIDFSHVLIFIIAGIAAICGIAAVCCFCAVTGSIITGVTVLCCSALISSVTALGRAVLPLFVVFVLSPDSAAPALVSALACVPPAELLFSAFPQAAMERARIRQRKTDIIFFIFLCTS